MNINPSGLEKYYSGRIMIWNNDSGINPGPVRPAYRCTFCKRGFSNAQALGGHMNIHRKDRAKLREISEEHMLSLDVSNSQDDFQASSSAVGKKLGLENSDEMTGKACSDDKTGDSQETERNPNMIVSPGFQENSTMMLFSESPTGKCVGRDLEKSDGVKIQFQGKGIDLELRLGPGKT